MNKNEAIKKAAHFFAGKEDLKEITITEDGQAFENKSNAINHAKSLPGKPEPITVQREDEVSDVNDEPEMRDHVVTQEDLDANEELAISGVEVGNTIQVPVIKE